MICPYCEQEKKEVNSWGCIDNRFDYACRSCNDLYVAWLHGKITVQEDWPAHLKTIAECSEVYAHQCEWYGQDKVPRDLIDFSEYIK